MYTRSQSPKKRGQYDATVRTGFEFEGQGFKLSIYLFIYLFLYFISGIVAHIKQK